MHPIVVKRIAPMARYPMPQRAGSSYLSEYSHSVSTSHGDDPPIKLITYDVFEEKSAQELLFEVCEKYIFFFRISDSDCVVNTGSTTTRGTGSGEKMDRLRERIDKNDQR
jgi:hypothetical protein